MAEIYATIQKLHNTYANFIRDYLSKTVLKAIESQHCAVKG